MVSKEQQAPEESFHSISFPQWQQFTVEKTNAHRICTAPHGWSERLGDNILLNYQGPHALGFLDSHWSEWAGSNLPEAKAYRVFSRYLPKQNTERATPTLLRGNPMLPAETEVTENGVRYAIDFSAGYAVGLFLDQRANRGLLRAFKPKRLLNTFAYTCSFSVCAALAGADTLSIDLSKKSLERGAENFRLNAIPTSGHRFIADDVLDVIPRLVQTKERFDAIILDPPTFSRGNKGRRFQAENDLEKLLLLALDVAAPEARILLSTNCTRVRFSDLESMSRFALKSRRLSGQFLRATPLPDFPHDAGAQTLWIHLRP
jgi:23S rRNA (cytosine1962-C5)-methyltransferase